MSNNAQKIPFVENYKDFNIFASELLSYLQNVRSNGAGQQPILYIARGDSIKNKDWLDVNGGSMPAQPQLNTTDYYTIRFVFNKEVPTLRVESNGQKVKDVPFNTDALLAFLQELNTTTSAKDSGKSPVVGFIYTPGDSRPAMYDPDTRMVDPEYLSWKKKSGIVFDDLANFLNSINEQRGEKNQDAVFGAMQRALRSMPNQNGNSPSILLFPFDEVTKVGDQSSKETCSRIEVKEDGSTDVIESNMFPSECLCLNLVETASKFGALQFTANSNNLLDYTGTFNKYFAANDMNELVKEAGAVEQQRVGGDKDAKLSKASCPPSQGCPKGWSGPFCTNSSLVPGICVGSYSGQFALRDFVVDAVQFFGPKRKLVLLFYPGTCEIATKPAELPQGTISLRNAAKKSDGSIIAPPVENFEVERNFVDDVVPLVSSFLPQKFVDSYKPEAKITQDMSKNDNFSANIPSGLPWWAILLIVIACLLVVAAIVGAIVYAKRKKNNNVTDKQISQYEKSFQNRVSDL